MYKEFQYKCTILTYITIIIIILYTIQKQHKIEHNVEGAICLYIPLYRIVLSHFVQERVQGEGSRSFHRIIL